MDFVWRVCVGLGGELGSVLEGRELLENSENGEGSGIVFCIAISSTSN